LIEREFKQNVKTTKSIQVSSTASNYTGGENPLWKLVGQIKFP